MAYGTGTRSYNRSMEARTLKEERAKATQAYIASKPMTIEIPVPCRCMWSQYPHLNHEALYSSSNWSARKRS